MKYLVTGSSGFIGFHLTKKICGLGHQVVGIDNLNDYYDIDLKKSRNAALKKIDNFKFFEIDLNDRCNLEKIFLQEDFQRVIHLAAQAGVRYSITNPMSYVHSNLEGFLNILELCKESKTEHLIYASSSSVYGNNNKVPFLETDRVDSPVSLYAATKRSNELMAYSYSHLYKIPCTGVRFFTVYGPWGRPDMAYYSFTNSIIKNKEIDVYNNGELYRDFTFIDDVTEGIIKILESTSDRTENSSSNIATDLHKIYNLGRGKPIKLLDFIEILETKLEKKAKKKFLSMQPGDVYKTYANIDKLKLETGFEPKIPFEQGIKRFVDWYKEYHQL